MPPRPQPVINVTNFQNGDILTYPLAIIKGSISPPTRQIHISTPTPSPTYNSHPVNLCKFIALYSLQPGPNQIHLYPAPPNPSQPSTQHTDHTSASHTLTLVYHPPSPARPFIRLVYLVCSDSPGSFHSPDPAPMSNILSAINRIQTAGLMLQSAMAEMMHAHNFQRRTFALAPKVRVHRLANLTTREAHAMTGHELYTHVHSALATLPHRERSIDVAIMSFTTMTRGQIKAHTALGGGRLALFGGASLFTWPVDVNEIVMRLKDFRPFDKRQYFDDSAFRMETFGRRMCTATTIGAVLHETGHCLSLRHPTGEANQGGGGIMSRGFDHFDRLFVQAGVGEALPFWDRGSAVRLRHHRFLSFEGEEEMRRLRLVRTCGASGGDNGPRFVKVGQRVVCRSEVGIGHVGYYSNGDNASHEEFEVDEEPTEFSLPVLQDIRSKCQMSVEDRLVVSAIDVFGRIVDQPYDDIR